MASLLGVLVTGSVENLTPSLVDGTPSFPIPRWVLMFQQGSLQSLTFMGRK